jgi:hypothetical protein
MANFKTHMGTRWAFDKGMTNSGKKDEEILEPISIDNHLRSFMKRF